MFHYSVLFYKREKNDIPKVEKQYPAKYIDFFVSYRKKIWKEIANFEKNNSLWHYHTFLVIK